MSRDYVYFSPNERVDLPDFNALQYNLRSGARIAHRTALFGADTTASRQSRVWSPWIIKQASPADATVVVTPGSASGTQSLPNGDTDGVAFFGDIEAATPVIIDFTGAPANTYGLYVRYGEDPASSGTRVFWDGNIPGEDPRGVSTRLASGWDLTFALSSPGSEYHKIADVVWDGASIDDADITYTYVMFFEGDSDNAYAHEWGDGPNDRNASRKDYGIGDFHQFVHMVRRQIEEIVGGGQKFYEIPTVSINDHATDGSDPHGTVLVQSGGLQIPTGGTTFDITLSGANNMLLEQDGTGAISILTNSGSGLINVASSGTLFLSSAGTVDIDGGTNVDIAAVDDIYLSGAGLLDIAFTEVTFGGGTVTLGDASDTVVIRHDQWNWELQGNTFVEVRRSAHPLGWSISAENAANTICDEVNGLITPTNASDQIRASYALDLPHGSQLRDVNFRFSYNATTGNHTAYVVRINNATGTTTTLASVGPTAPGASGIHVETLNVNTTIDTDIFNYFMFIELDNASGAAASVRFFACDYAVGVVDLEETLGINGFIA